MGREEYIQQPFETLALLWAFSIRWFLVDITGQIIHCDRKNRQTDIANMQLDEIDQALIGALRTNARTSVARLGKQFGIARTTVQSRIDRLEARGVIAGYTLRLGAAGRPALRATALVAIEPRAAAEVLMRLKSLRNVVAVHTTSGRFDLLVQISAASTEELDLTLDYIGGAKGVKSSESLIHLTTKISREA
jgi:DNA-binding Lrp family transcriptional regulator